ncbi:LmbE family protein [Nitratireductor aquibiodomus RA22]|uniref:LmbE family protein n=1 Tax=Nitratireductor aquibiodomus RA22 TaxID=1189611 RepID=I5C8T2_9HYPH|nr:PIG-L family deacetylase [Nitratireductor aquibiodomus]EIM78234.1 LmbE family protein [Nitratireductor aquibiodomus RA22]
MPVSDQERIATQMRNPRIVRLWQALAPLRSCVSFMNTGAHPDDETSEMLAALALRDGIALSYACANRGEGGQNAIGSEGTHDLGVVRTAEMERAADVLKLNLYWLSETPDDTIFDFGFSKSGTDTLEKWGRERALKRFVEIIRTERPDIICPTFLDIPGQHGHHRAMTGLAHEVMSAAADPTFPDVDLPVWQVKKLYLPAWSGAGDNYDDDLPPPNATLTVKASGEDPVTGWSWAQIGEQSRAFHLTQGMGRWVPYGEPNDWPLHLVRSEVDGPDNELTDGLPATLADLAEFAGAPEIADHLEMAQTACEAAFAAFPDMNRVALQAAMALKAVRAARDACPDRARGEVQHRLAAKEIQLSHVMRIASGVSVRATLERDVLRPGEEVTLSIETTGPVAEVTPVLPEGWRHSDGVVHVPAGAQSTDCYPAVYRPGVARLPAIRVVVTVGGVSSETLLPLERAPVVLPARSATLSPDRALINAAAETRQIDLRISDVFPHSGQAALALPSGWNAEPVAGGLRVEAPQDVASGLYSLPLQIDGAHAETENRIAYPHIDARARTFPAQLSVRVLDVALPDVRIGYIGGGNDRVGHWLRALGLDVTDLADNDLTADSLRSVDTVVVGIFAMRARPALKDAMPQVKAWVEAGGNLLTLYHRPWDDWDPETVPPRRLEIGKPSLRWRVTDENADVTHLVPGHPLLNTPNRITDEDWKAGTRSAGFILPRAGTRPMSRFSPWPIPMRRRMRARFFRPASARGGTHMWRSSCTIRWRSLCRARSA